MSQHEDIGVCTECKSDQPDSYTIKQLQMGFDPFVCKYCGGVAKIVLKSDRKNALKISDRSRGLT